MIGNNESMQLNTKHNKGEPTDLDQTENLINNHRYSFCSYQNSRVVYMISKHAGLAKWSFYLALTFP